VPGPTGMDGKEILLGITPREHQDRRRPLRGRVLVVEPLGSHALLTVMVGNESIKVVAPADTTLRATRSSASRPSRTRSVGWTRRPARP